MQNNPLTLRQRLIEAVDESYHVKDMGAIVEVLGTLEKLAVTKELLETTRLGKTVNEFRRKVNDEKLAKRAKALVKKWRDAVLPDPTTATSLRPVNGSASTGGASLDLHLSRSGFTSNSSSPKLLSLNSKISPNSNSNSLSPRILSNLTTNANVGRNGRGFSSTASSPSLSFPFGGSSVAASPSLRLSSPSQKKVLTPTASSSPQANNNRQGQGLLSNSSSYAPNAEVVARTNAANKRLRIEDEGSQGIGGPPAKKLRTLNGGYSEGLLDDPPSFALALDEELSKDSVASSDGRASNFVISAAPSPLSAANSNLPSPSGVGDVIIMGAEEHANGNGATVINQSQEEPAIIEVVAAPKKKGRKPKNKMMIMDATALLQEQILKAKEEGKLRTIQRLSMETCDDELSSRPPSQPSTPAPPPTPAPAPTPILKEDPIMNNEFVENYLQSQSELRVKMEREALASSAAPSPSHSPPAEEPVKRKKKKEKKRNKGEPPVPTYIFPNEFEILAKLPPIPESVLEELKDFVFDESSAAPPQPPLPSSEGEKTEKESLNQNQKSNEEESATSSETTQKSQLLSSKIDWGDSDDEDEAEAPSVEKDATTSTPSRDLDSKAPTTPSHSEPEPGATTLNLEINFEKEEEMETEDAFALDPNPPPKEVDPAEVDRLHLEKIVSLNGNLDRSEVFREWQEVLAVDSLNGDTLHILPYTVIDF